MKLKLAFNCVALLFTCSTYPMKKVETISSHKLQAAQLIKGLSQSSEAIKIYQNYANTRIKNAQNTIMHPIEIRNLDCFLKESHSNFSEKSSDNPLRISYRFAQQVKINLIPLLLDKKTESSQIMLQESTQLAKALLQILQEKKNNE